jgi:predicted alpha/beta superfamily hydrolase
MISLPHYDYDEPKRKWPVIYLTDGNFLFGITTDTVRFMAWCETTTDAIVVIGE